MHNLIEKEERQVSCLDDIRLLIAGLFFSLILYAWLSRHTWYIINGTEGRKLKYAWVLNMAAALPVLFMCAVNIPLPVFYILFYIMYCPSAILLKEKKREGLLIVNGHFLLFAAPHLVVLGVLALALQTDVKSVLENTSMRIISLAAVTLLSSGFLFWVNHYMEKMRLYYQKGDLQELQLFSRFVWFCVCSVIIDGIPCLFALPTKFSILFMVGSNILLLLMAVLFASHVCAILRDAHLKEEYFRLQEEEMIQRNRTARLEHEAYLDGLTGIYTRAYVMTNLDNMLKNRELFTLAFLDLDGLRNVNNQQGHMAGDRYLQDFVSYVRERLYPNNIFARYGGDEFLLLMPDCLMEKAEQKLTEIQSGATSFGLPFSFGLIQPVPEMEKSAVEWVKAADKSMYEDKKSRKMHKGGNPL